MHILIQNGENQMGPYDLRIIVYKTLYLQLNNGKIQYNVKHNVILQ